MELSNEARKARNRYQSEYRRNNGRKPLTEIQREERNRYLREYRRKNPDKVKEYQNRYWEKKANETNQIFMQHIFSRS